MKNITLSAEENMIEAARARAAAEHTTFNEQFRRWLAGYAGQRSRLGQRNEVTGELRGKKRRLEFVHADGGPTSS